ncbi:MAG: WYL domain-containing protein [Candidatus Kapabacteria bacterium]|nr:WYL domain-containing protein [Candidatus Kapabacteria bacterium]
MKSSENEKAEQAKRVLFIYKKFLSGNNFTVNDLINILKDEGFINTSERSIQRDISIIRKMDESLQFDHEGHAKKWSLSGFAKLSTTNLKLKEEELLSFYMLKGYLKNFKGTVIEDDIKAITKKLEELAPGEGIHDELLITEENFGQYDYSSHPNILIDLIKYANEKTWIKFDYLRYKDDRIKNYTVFPHGIFHYSGIFYLIAYYPIKKILRNYAIQKISNLEESYEPHNRIPKFDEEDFEKHNFGAHYGDPVDIELRIPPEAAKFYEHRIWHISQKLRTQKDGSLKLTMTVPIVSELVEWILSANHKIEIISPQRLKDAVNEALKTNT